MASNNLRRAALRCGRETGRQRHTRIVSRHGAVALSLRNVRAQNLDFEAVRDTITIHCKDMRCRASDFEPLGERFNGNFPSPSSVFYLPRPIDVP